VSYLVNFTIPPAYGLDSYIGWRTRVTDISLRSYVHGSATNIGVGAAVNDTLVYDNSGNLAGNGTFMIISKFDDLAGTASTADTWAIDAAAYDLIAPGGITEAELNANAFLHAAQTEGATTVAWFDGQGYDFYLGADCVLLLDEVKIGTTLSAVVDKIPYGDFTGEGDVNMDDLKIFIEAWLVNDCVQADPIDLNGDCDVDLYEFSRMVHNWLD